MNGGRLLPVTRAPGAAAVRRNRSEFFEGLS